MVQDTPRLGVAASRASTEWEGGALVLGALGSAFAVCVRSVVSQLGGPHVSLEFAVAFGFLLFVLIGVLDAAEAEEKRSGVGR